MERRYHLVLDAKETSLLTLAWVLLMDMARGNDVEAATMVRSFLVIEQLDQKSVESVYRKIGKLLDSAITEERAAKIAADLKGRMKQHGD